jgi:hypothetical protein
VSTYLFDAEEETVLGTDTVPYDIYGSPNIIFADTGYQSVTVTENDTSGGGLGKRKIEGYGTAIGGYLLPPGQQEIIPTEGFAILNYDSSKSEFFSDYESDITYRKSLVEMHSNIIKQISIDSSYYYYNMNNLSDIANVNVKPFVEGEKSDIGFQYALVLLKDILPRLKIGDLKPAIWISKDGTCSVVAIIHADRTITTYNLSYRKDQAWELVSTTNYQSKISSE